MPSGRENTKLVTAETGKRRWTVIGSGLLCGALAFVVIYTTPRAFFSPLALVVVTAIGLAAVLLQVRFRGQPATNARAPFWFNVVGIVLALLALFADLLHLTAGMFQVAALGAVGCFSVSSAVVLQALRKRQVMSK